MFPKDFIWGIATSSYQIEGGGQAHGRGISMWDAIRKESNRITDKYPSDQTIKGYENWKDDIQLVKNLGVSHYRLSLNWSRLFPYGDVNCINREGVKYYRNILEEVVSLGIEPIVTIYHADLPLRLYKNNSWLNDNAISWFEDLARFCFETYGDLVKIWTTFNDAHLRAWCDISKMEGVCFHGVTGVFEENDYRIPYLAAHRILLAHTKVYHMYKKEFFEKQNGKVGIGLCGELHLPKTPKDEEAAKRSQIFHFDWLASPIFGEHGDYPEEMKKRLGTEGLKYLPEFTEEQKQEIRGASDFFAFNYYRPIMIEEGIGNSAKEKMAEVQYTEDNWERIAGDNFWLRNEPDGLFKILLYIKENYKNIPVLITENGCSDVLDSIEDPLEDDHRIRYIDGHVKAVKRAIEQSCNVMGYIAWSLLDNFEWNEGYSVKFGFYKVDMDSEDMKRTPKKSCYFYKNLIEMYTS